MSYIRIWVHCVWGTKNRIVYFDKQNAIQTIKHIRENAKMKDIYIDFINIHKDHVHSLLSLNSGHSIDKDIQLIKGESYFWINKTGIIKGKFSWADEYFAVSVSESNVNIVRNYIKNQEKHHKVKTWEDEYNEFISKFEFKKFNG